MIAISYLQKVEKQLDNLWPVLNKMLDNSSIESLHRGTMNYFDLGYHHEWHKKDELSQIAAKKIFLNFQQSMQLLYIHFNTKMVEQLVLADYSILSLIEQTDAPESIEIARRSIGKDFDVFKKYLALLKKENADTIIVPDTNAIIQYPGPSSYRRIKANDFSFVMLPTVISELDKLKIYHKNDSFREKVKSVIRRLKGYRNQGDILNGIIVDKDIKVKMVAVEPDFKKTLKWLDISNQDDRIIASVLELQVQNPSDCVVLVTSDLNLQNKAQMANLIFADTDDFD